MSEERAEPALECDECGYALDGLARPGAPVRCPECGRAYLRPPALGRKPWPHWSLVGLRLCGPHAALAVAVIFLMAARPHPGCMILMLTVPIGWTLLVFVAPAHYARHLVRRHARPADREHMTALLTIAGWAGNLLLTGIAAVLTVAAARW